MFLCGRFYCERYGETSDVVCVFLFFLSIIFTSTRALQVTRKSASYSMVWLATSIRHGGHVGVQDNTQRRLLGIWLYCYAKLERHFATLYTNVAVSSHKQKRRIDVVGSGIYLIVTVFTIKWRPIGIVVLCGEIIPGGFLRASHIGDFNGTSCEDHRKWFAQVLSFQQPCHFAMTL